MHFKTTSFSITRLIIFAGIFFIPGSCADQEETKEQPNILVFFSDELAPGYLSCYGGDIHTPNLDRLASEGMLFQNAYTSAPMCTPSRYSLLTGNYPGRCEHPSFISNNPVDEPYVIAWNTYIDSTAETLPRALSDMGYTTGMTGKWHLGIASGTLDLPDLSSIQSPADEGADGKLKAYQENVSLRVRTEAGFDYTASVIWENNDNFPVKALQHHNFPWITHGAINFLEEQAGADKPFFLYIATTAVHGPAHQESLEKNLNYTQEGYIEGLEEYGLPDAALKKIKSLPPHKQHLVSGMTELDNHVGIVLNKLEQLNLDEETIVVFAADHNVEPGKATCYEKGFHIPMIIKWPGKIKENSRTDELIQTVDLYPTLLSLAGHKEKEESVIDGINFSPILVNGQTGERNFIYYESGLARGISDGHMKYIAFRYPDAAIEQMKTGEIDYAPNYINLFKQAHSSIAIKYYPHYFDADQLYDLDQDPYEQKNLAYNKTYNDTLVHLQNKLEEILVTFKHPYDLSDTAFMMTDKFDKLADKTKSLGTDYIGWFRRDHGEMIWPPEQD